jgi:hypothetical protein
VGDSHQHVADPRSRQNPTLQLPTPQRQLDPQPHLGHLHLGCEQPQCATKNADDPKSKESTTLDALVPPDATGCEERRRRDSNPGWRIMSPVRTRMDLRMTCDSLQTPGLRVQQTPRKHGQSRVQVTLKVTPPESVTDWQSLSAAHGPRSPSRSCGRRSDQSDPHGASRLSGDPLSRTPKDRQSPRNRTTPPPLARGVTPVIACSLRWTVGYSSWKLWCWRRISAADSGSASRP